MEPQQLAAILCISERSARGRLDRLCDVGYLFAHLGLVSTDGSYYRSSYSLSAKGRKVLYG